MAIQPSTGFTEQIPLSEWAQLHAYLIWIYDGPVDPVGRQGTVSAPHMTAWLIRSGSVELKVGGRQFSAREGEWIFPPPGEVWRRFSEGARILSVRFRASWPSGAALFSEGLGLRLKASEHPELTKAAERLARFVKQKFPHLDTNLLNAPSTLQTHLGLQKHFGTWLDESVGALVSAGLVPTHMGHIDGRLLQAVRRIEKHTLATPFSEPELAAEIGISVSQLNRLFQRQFRVSSRGYFERRRLEYAVSALQGSSRTVKEIAFELGFSSLPHFSAWAKRRLGHGPRAFRANPLEYQTGAAASAAPAKPTNRKRTTASSAGSSRRRDSSSRRKRSSR